MKVKNLTYQEIINLIGKKIQFTSDCDFFPFFNITGIVVNINFNNDEYIFIVKLNTGKITKISSNMKNLTIKIL